MLVPTLMGRIDLDELRSMKPGDGIHLVSPPTDEDFEAFAPR